MDLPDPGNEPGSPALQADSLPAEGPGNSPMTLSSVQFSSVTQSCPTLCDYELEHCLPTELLVSIFLINRLYFFTTLLDHSKSGQNIQFPHNS